jgi:hypothetical protein
MLYFDNQPKQHYGTIRQQIWSALHFPLHLAIVGVVEGAQQLVLAHYTLTSADKFGTKLVEICVKKKLDGAKLRDALTNALAYYAFEDKPETFAQSQVIMERVWFLGNTTGVCSADSIKEQVATNGYAEVSIFSSYCLWPRPAS